MNVRDEQRHRDRARALRVHADAYEAARTELLRIHGSGGRQRANYLIRRVLILARGQGPRPVGRQSPAATLAPVKGWALHLYLVAIFQAQARRPPGYDAVDNTRPLHGSGHTAGWIDLLPAITNTANRTAGMTRQTIRALTLLDRENLVNIIGRPGIPGRYERFRLLNEGGTSDGYWRPPYTIPTAEPFGDTSEPAWLRPPAPVAGRSPVMGLPTAFFLNGWVHVLSAAEITTYLMILDLETRYPKASNLGVYAAKPQRIGWYGIHRDIYATHRQLAAFQLIHRFDDPNRRPDGTLSYRPGPMLQPYGFQTNPDGFDRPALATVSAALETNDPTYVSRARGLP